MTDHFSTRVMFGAAGDLARTQAIGRPCPEAGAAASAMRAMLEAERA